MTHIPVMLNEVLHYLNPDKNKTYVDCTFGAGGYTSAILSAAKCNVIAFDHDIKETTQFAQECRSKFGDRFTFIGKNFSEIKTLNKPVDGIIFDLGLSSMQINNYARGFSFNSEINNNLDMRMSEEIENSAYHIVNYYNIRELFNLIKTYGEDKYAYRIANAIIKHRMEKKFTNSMELAKVIRNTVPKKQNKIDPATRTFQALRITVNNEIDTLQKTLTYIPQMLNLNGKLIAVSFHSLEDRVVKQHIQQFSIRYSKKSKYHQQKIESGIYNVITKKPLTPSQNEIDINPRSRSAKMRVIEKIVSNE